MIKPFKKIEAPAKNKIATRKWVFKALQLVLAKLHISADGIDISEDGGHIHLKAKPTATSEDRPFAVKPVDVGFTVSAGLVFSGNYETAASGQPIYSVPLINGVPINNTVTPPKLLTGKNSTGVICLEARFDVYGTAVMPWEIKAFTTEPQNQAIVRADSGLNQQPVEGIYYIPIASFSQGLVTKQWAFNNIMVNLLWNDIQVWS